MIIPHPFFVSTGAGEHAFRWDHAEGNNDTEMRDSPLRGSLRGRKVATSTPSKAEAITDMRPPYSGEL